MTWEEIEVDPRHFRRQIQRGIRGSLIRALAELITNADDSYIRLEGQGVRASGNIRIEYTGARRQGSFRVIDEAEGIDDQRMREVFKRYGGDTSGFSAGYSTRGYFGRGAKDALLSMKDGRVISLKEGRLYECHLKMIDGKPSINILPPQYVKSKTRREFDIARDGTVVEFDLPGEMRVPQFETLREGLARFFMLRKINSSSERTVTLRKDRRSEQVRYAFPEGELLIRESFPINYGSYPPFRVDLEVYRASEDLDQSSLEKREGGLLIFDDQGAGLDLTLFRFDRDQYASRLFGEIRIHGFRALLNETEQSVLSETRDGLEQAHPFVRTLMQRVETHLAAVVQKEREDRKAEERPLSRRERERLNRALEKLNEIAAAETKDPGSVGPDPGTKIPPPAGGLALLPAELSLIVGRIHPIWLKVDTKVLEAGEVVSLSSSDPSVSLHALEVKIPDEPEPVLIRQVKVLGTQAGITGTITATCGIRIAKLSFVTIEEHYPHPSDGLLFDPEELEVVDGRLGVLDLYVDSTRIPTGTQLTVGSSDPNIVVIDPHPLVPTEGIKDGIARLEVRLRGHGIGLSAVITAEDKPWAATALVRVISSQKERKQKKGRSGLFKHFRFDPNASRQERCHYEDGYIVIHTKEPTIDFYLGHEAKHRDLLHAQVIVAEVVTQCVCDQIAFRQIESGARVYFSDSDEGRLQEDQVQIRHLVYKHGKDIHQAIVDAQVLRAEKQTQGIVATIVEETAETEKFDTEGAQGEPAE